MNPAPAAAAAPSASADAEQGEAEEEADEEVEEVEEVLFRCFPLRTSRVYSLRKRRTARDGDRPPFNTPATAAADDEDDDEEGGGMSVAARLRCGSGARSGQRTGSGAAPGGPLPTRRRRLPASGRARRRRPSDTLLFGSHEDEEEGRWCWRLARHYGER